jgi:hypothetical protein
VDIISYFFKVKLYIYLTIGNPCSLPGSAALRARRTLDCSGVAASAEKCVKKGEINSITRKDIHVLVQRSNGVKIKGGTHPFVQKMETLSSSLN